MKFKVECSLRTYEQNSYIKAIKELRTAFGLELKPAKSIADELCENDKSINSNFTIICNKEQANKLLVYFYNEREMAVDLLIHNITELKNENITFDVS